MTSRQLVDFVEGKLEFYGVAKVIPGGEVIHQHARHHLENKLTGELIAQHAEEITKRAAATELPADLVTQVYKLLKDEPAILGPGARPAHLNSRSLTESVVDHSPKDRLVVPRSRPRPMDASLFGHP